MIPAQFDYVAPTTVAEALTALAEAGDEGENVQLTSSQGRS